ncbi:MAG: response regulator [Myxococcaceae bacterium]|nr:response regulator [Myxococcaceae bacterium]
MAHLLERLDAWARVGPGADERARTKARFVAIGAMLGGLVSLVSTLALGWSGSWRQGTDSAVGMLICLTVLVLFHFTRNLVAVAHVFAAFLSLSFYFSTVGLGGIGNIGLLALIPLVTLFLAGRRVGLGWLAVSMVIVLACWLQLRPTSVEARSLFDADVLRLSFLSPTVFFVGFIYDLGQERALKTLQTAREVAEAASREKSRFLAKVSHEIRTPLNGVLGTAELALLDDPKGPVKEHLVTIQRSGSTLLGLINDLLDVARAEAGKFELSQGPFLPAGLVTDVVTLHRARASAKGLTLSAQVDVPTSLRLLGDSLRLRQVLGNLVSNAIKFTERGGVVVRCEGAAEGQGWRLRFTVTDTGPGISEEGRARLFMPFSQLTADSAGTGLGLAISRQVVDAMRGRLLLTSEVGKGSTFGFEVMLPETAQALEHTPVASRLAIDARVLVVDDNVVNVKVAEGLLQRLGLTTGSAQNGAEALERLAVERFDLVLMDLQMPVLDGLEATRQLRARGDQTPVLALTASAMPEDLAACRAAGMQDCLTKPLRMANLIQAVLAHVPEVSRHARLERLG